MLHISEKYLQFRKFKNAKYLLRKIVGLPHTCNQPDLLTVELFFKLCISERYTHNDEKNWKNSVCIGVKKFENSLKSLNKNVVKQR